MVGTFKHTLSPVYLHHVKGLFSNNNGQEVWCVAFDGLLFVHRHVITSRSLMLGTLLNDDPGQHSYKAMPHSELL